MTMKIWEKGISVDQLIERFTIGDDAELDLQLAPWDVIGTLAHIRMLAKVGLLDPEELPILEKELRKIYQDIQAGNFQIEEGVEDIHSQVELMLTRSLGEIGKKVHSGRSRNDQVLVDIKLFLRAEIEALCQGIEEVFELLLQLSHQYREVLLPGYTHLQIAMPSSFGLWLGAYAESLADDLLMLRAAYDLINQNPLGSGAGYGSSFPLDRQMTTDLLAFEDLNYNVVYAQMGRGKVERNMSYALANLAATIGKLAYDMTLYLNQNFGFITFPDQFTTGSSIMPHKKNPDVWELTRARCNQIQALPQEMLLISNNLPSGYHRDFQLLKEHFFPALSHMKLVLTVLKKVLPEIQVNPRILEDDKYAYLFTVEAVQQLVLQGLPFREAYQQVARQLADGSYEAPRELDHSLAGGIHNLCHAEIRAKFQKVKEGFNFERVQGALHKLLGERA
ncbi:MAG: argininosuccinate lyase [Bacteroidota bacterium]